MLPSGLVLFVKLTELKAGHYHLPSTTLKCIQEVLKSYEKLQVPLNHGIRKNSDFNSTSKRNRILITKFSSLNFKKSNNNKYGHFKLRFESLQKHKQLSLNIKPNTHHHLSLTKVQKGQLEKLDWTLDWTGLDSGLDWTFF